MNLHTQLTGKQVMLQIRNSKPVTATVRTTDDAGIWLHSGAILAAAVLEHGQIKNPMFFVPWTSVDWVVMHSE